MIQGFNLGQLFHFAQMKWKNDGFIPKETVDQWKAQVPIQMTKTCRMSGTMSNTWTLDLPGFNYLKHERIFVKFQNITKSSTSSAINQLEPAPKKFSIFDKPTANHEQLELDDEISNYSNMNIASNEDSNPLDFWKMHSYQFPILSIICKKIFSIPCTSVPSERLFSKSGEIVSLKRNKQCYEN
jgi:hypothetical protein